VADGRVIAVGGETALGSSEVDAYDPTTQTWSPLDPLPGECPSMPNTTIGRFSSSEAVPTIVVKRMET
jgi:hypothetical protein